MSVLLFLEDSYLKEFDARVLEMKDRSVVLDRTAFYPGGGGQPNDVGSFYSGDVEVKVLKVSKDGELVLHELESPALHPGDVVKGTIDWEARYSHMQHHTAIHVLCGVAWERSKAISTGSQIYGERARVDFDLEKLSSEIAKDFEEEANQVIARNLPVALSFVERDEALRKQELFRTIPGLELAKALEKVRLVEIQGFDIQADGGTHVKNTSEIGRLKITKTESKGKRNKRLEFQLESR